MRAAFRIGLFCWMGFGVAALAHAAEAACDAVVPARALTPTGRRTVTADDLVRMRDIGAPDASSGFDQPSPLGVSPDHRQISFVISQANPDANLYCRALVVLGTDGAPPRVLDRGGELITKEGPWLADTIIPNGAPVVVTPVWSRDGQWIAYLRRDAGVTQLWRARADGGGAAAITHAPVDIQSFAWSRDGQRLVYASYADRVDVERQIDQEGRAGWFYDSRIIPALSPRPRNLAALPLVVAAIDLRTGLSVPADKRDAALLDRASWPSALSENGWRAWLERTAGSSHAVPHLMVARPGGQAITCAFATCSSPLTGLWWDRAGTTLTFLRREGWKNGQMALYRWKPGRGAPRRILQTDDAILGCTLALDDLICTRENATVPRTVVKLDPRTGRSQRLFDPNPEFAAIRLGKVRRLTWRNAVGLPAWGDLVLPPDYDGARKLPMIVVQYRSSGFLRGGTGNEYPIHAFAAHGFAVLSTEDPDPLPPRPTGTPAESYRATARWDERRSLLSSLVTGVDLAIATGFVDPKRIGITGLSDGATGAKFALLNTKLFAAAAISQASIEPRTQMTYFGEAFADLMRAQGYPPASHSDAAFWRPMSFAANAKALTAPVLMQVSQDEFIGALEAFTALRENDRAVELYVFPGEHHVKSQPAHRKAVFERSLDWFDFWLQGRIDPAPAKVEQYRRWAMLRAERQRPSSADGAAAGAGASQD